MSYEAERDTIGCLLIDNEVIERVDGILSPEKFENATLGRVYYEVKQAYDKGQRVDERLICFQLSDLDSDYVNQLLLDCYENATTSVFIEKYAKQVNDEYKARQLSNLLNMNPDAKNIDEQLKNLCSSVEVLQSDRTSTQRTMKQLVKEHSANRFNENKKQGIKLGISELDNMLNGLDGGDVALICARPAVGKTAFLIQLARNVAGQGIGSHVFSLEMTNEQIYDRFIAHESGISLTRIRRGISYVNNEEELFTGANKRLEDLPLFFNDDKYTVTDMRAELRKSGAKIAFIDYAQLIHPESYYKGNRVAEVGQISHALKQLAKDLDIPVVVLCQLNRVIDETKEPSMNEIRESGDFEQDASIIMLLWNTKEDKTEKGIKVDKNRSGETGKFKMNYEGKTFTFSTNFVSSDEETPFDF